jgi:hypothetical protein
VSFSTLGFDEGRGAILTYFEQKVGLGLSEAGPGASLSNLLRFEAVNFCTYTGLVDSTGFVGITFF